MGSDLRREDRR